MANAIFSALKTIGGKIAGAGKATAEATAGAARALPSAPGAVLSEARGLRSNLAQSPLAERISGMKAGMKAGISSRASSIGTGAQKLGNGMALAGRGGGGLGIGTALRHGGDTVAVSGVGGAIGGIHGGMTYDPNQERDPLLSQTPTIGRFKAAAKGALKGAAYGAAGAAGAKGLQFGARSMLAPEARHLASTETLTGGFMRGFRGMNAPGDIPLGETAARGKKTAAEGGYFSFNKVHGKSLDEVDDIIKEGEKAASPAKKAAAEGGYNQTYEVPSGTSRGAQGKGLHTAQDVAEGAKAPERASIPRPIIQLAGTPNRPLLPKKTGINLGETAPVGKVEQMIDVPTGVAPSATTKRINEQAKALNEEAGASYRGSAAQAGRQKNLYEVSEEIGLDVNTGTAANARGMTYENVQQFRGLSQQQQGLVGATELPGIVASAIGGIAGTVTHAAKAGIGAYKKHIIDPTNAAASKATSAGFGRILNPNYEEAAASGAKGIKKTLSRDVTAPFVATSAIAGAAIFGVGGAIGSTAYGAPAGHPMNAIFRTGDSAISAKAQMEADAAQKIKMQRPTMLGLNDSDEAYYTNPALKPHSGARHTPGKYNDDGSLVFALSNLRRAS